MDKPEGIRALMPRQLPPDAVRDGSREFPSETQLGAQTVGKFLWAVVLLRHIPLKLIHQRYIPNMNIQLEVKDDHMIFTTSKELFCNDQPVHEAQ